MTKFKKQITTKNKLFWAFNGNMEEEEVRRQIADFKAKGFGGFFMHARGGLTVPYMSEQWLDAVAVAVDEAKKQGLEAWLYDEDGWPSGFGGGAVNGKGEDYCQKVLVRVNGGGKCEYPLKSYKTGGKGIAPLRGSRYDCFKKAGFRVCEEGEEEDVIYGYGVNKFYADIFNGKATDEFINCTHEKYKKRFENEFGKTIKGIFTDEPQYSHHPYSPYLFDFFKERWGYDAADWLFLLEEDSEAGRIFREDFYGAVCFLYKKNYVEKISAWCKKNNLLFTGHFPEEDGVSTQYLKGGDIMLNYIDMDYPGIDFLGRRLTSPVLLKQISSVKNQLGKAHIISESFGCCGWDTSLAQYKWIWGYQSAFGIDTACMHLAAYTVRGVRKRDYPAFFSYQSSWWEHMGALNDFMYRLNEFSLCGSPICDVLVLSPVTGIFGEAVKSDKAGFFSTQFRLLVEAFVDLQIQFDIADENYLSEIGYEAADGRLRVGEMSYGVLVVPCLRSIGACMSEMIAAAEKNGVRVAFATERPQDCEGEPVAERKNILRKGDRGFVVQNRKALWQKYFEFINYENKVNVISARDGYRSDGLVVRVREDEKKLYVAVFNKSVENCRRSLIGFEGTGTVYSVDCENGEKENVTDCFDGRRTHVAFDICCGETRLFVMEKGEFLSGKRWITKKTERLTPCGERLCDDNSFNIDKASLSVDGEAYGEEKYILKIQEDIHDLALKSVCERKAAVRYRFSVREKPSRVSLACECLTADSVEVNGVAVEFDDWYIDRAIRKADISPMLRTGVNEIVICCTVRPKKQAFDLKKVFETEKNRFAYQTETESVYLIGDFDVKAVGAVREAPEFYRVEDEGFFLTASEKKDFEGELTRQGLWFYRGSVSREFSYRYSGSGRVFLSLQDSRGVATQLLVNGKPSGYISGGESLEITSMLSDGENRIETKLIGSNRNLLGPHHHWAGEQRFVGVNTFKGTKGYEDEVVTVNAPENTFVSSYAFVKFKAGSLFVTEKFSGGRNEEKEA